MKSIILLASIFYITIHVSCEVEETSEEQFDRIREECFDENGITEEQRRMYDPEDEYLKCFNACIYRKLGFMQNGRIVPTKFVERVADILATLREDGKQRYITSVARCAKQANEEINQCERAYTMMKCF